MISTAWSRLFVVWVEDTGNMMWGEIMASHGYWECVAHAGAGGKQFGDTVQALINREWRNAMKEFGNPLCGFDQCRDFRAIRRGYVLYGQGCVLQ
jgi:hypothetical protein